jgi:hypothetical protein
MANWTLCWGPALPRTWFGAFRDAGGIGEFVQTPFLRKQRFEMKDPT